jgi:hypothetical protein
MLHEGLKAPHGTTSTVPADDDYDKDLRRGTGVDSDPNPMAHEAPDGGVDIGEAAAAMTWSAHSGDPAFRELRRLYGFGF